MQRSYSGDPGQFLPNNPFLDMLAGVEDNLELIQLQQGQHAQPTPAQQVIRSNKVKLPDFWAHSPGMWFARAELRFAVAGVHGELEKFAYAADALQYESLRLVTDLVTCPPADRPYTALKERLMIAHQLTPLQKAQRVSAMPPLGDRRPSQLLAALLEFCPDGEENTAFFRSAFIHRLPADLQVLLDTVETDDLKVLAQKADRLWITQASNQHRVAALPAEIPEPVEDDGCEAAIKAVKKKGGCSRGKDFGDKRKVKLLSICRTHMGYGADAYNCLDPANCKWAEN